MIPRSVPTLDLLCLRVLSKSGRTVSKPVGMASTVTVLYARDHLNDVFIDRYTLLVLCVSRMD